MAPDREVSDIDQDTLEERAADDREATTPDANRVVELDDPGALGSSVDHTESPEESAPDEPA